jgi:hypothetical protein
MYNMLRGRFPVQTVRAVARNRKVRERADLRQFRAMRARAAAEGQVVTAMIDGEPVL